MDSISWFSCPIALVSEFTWLATPDASWSSAALCEFRLLAALEMSPAKVDADESTCSRSALSVGSLSSDENESKKLVMSLPISPAVELDEPESGVNSACMLFNAVSRVLEDDASCCCWSSRSSRTRSRCDVAPVSVTPSPTSTPPTEIGVFSCQSGFSSVYPVVLALATLFATTFKASWSASRAPEITLKAELIVPMSIPRLGIDLRGSFRSNAI